MECRMKYLIPVLLLLASCVAPTPGVRKTDVVVRNTSPYPIEVRAKAGFLSRTIRLMPGEAWTGWVPAIPVSEVDIEMTAVPPVR